MMKKYIVSLAIVLCTCSSLLIAQMGRIQSEEGKYFQRLVRLPQDSVAEFEKFAQEISELPDAQMTSIIQFWFEALEQRIQNMETAPTMQARAFALTDYLDILDRIITLRVVFEKNPAFQEEARVLLEAYRTFLSHIPAEDRNVINKVLELSAAESNESQVQEELKELKAPMTNKAGPASSSSTLRRKKNNHLMPLRAPRNQMRASSSVDEE